VAIFQDDFGVIQISPDLDYQDGSEDIILQTLINANDRSAGSDELAEAIVDWPTRYHFSRLRQELFMPFKVEKGTRVLEIGCGTGVNLRYFAELGAEVVGVEGTLTRARAARVRCEGMQNVTVFAGDANVLPDLESFDLVLLIGVLEYSGARGGGLGTAEKLLATGSKFLKSDGALILAIENQIGLKYLLSYPEDHLGIPWVGPEGYREASGIRTWSRAGLQDLLSENGFSSQNWFYPYPDYKLPNFVASHDLYSTPLGKAALKSILRAPVVDYSASSQLACDPVWASQTMVDADIGPDVSNSFLVLAASQQDAQKRFINQGLGWLASGERLSQWRSRRLLFESDGKLTVALSPEMSIEKSTSSAWLKHENHDNVPFVEGEVLEDEIIRGFVLNNLESVKDNLNNYFQFLKQNVVSLSNSHEVVNPFVIQDSIGLLNGVMLDCIPKNLILDNQNTVHFIDKEWQTFGEVSLELVWYRGMTELALRIMATATPTPFGPLATVNDLVYSLSSMIGAPCSDLITKQYLAAEIELQRIVSGYDSTSAIHDRHNMTIRTIFKSGSSLAKHRHLAQLAKHIDELNRLREGELGQLSALQQQVEITSNELLHARAELQNVTGELLHVQTDLQNVTGELLHVQTERDSLLRSNSVKFGFMVTWPLRRLKSVLRQLSK
jgi:SAM-dependent methyltransferase/flagellar biosynthesis chaperone FliJ